MIFRLSGLTQHHNWLILLVSDITAAEKRRHLECSHNGGAFKGFIGFASDERDLSSTGKKIIIIRALGVNQKKTLHEKFVLSRIRSTRGSSQRGRIVFPFI